MPIQYYKYTGFALTLLAIGLFVPGIILPMFSLSMDMNVDVAGTGFASNLVNKDLSIITTIEELWTQDRLLVSALIFIFSILIPISKSSALCYVFFAKTKQSKLKVNQFVAAIGKWSMADVFVVAVFLAVLSTNHTENAEQHRLSFFGLSIDFEISTQTLSMVGQGFYFFTAYCLVSILGSQLLLHATKSEITKEQIET
jgi:uncharacterized paraquat-inducible protein A